MLTVLRRIIDDPDGPGHPFGGWQLPPGWRWETDDELRKRIHEVLVCIDADEPMCCCRLLDCANHPCKGECGCRRCYEDYLDYGHED